MAPKRKRRASNLESSPNDDRDETLEVLKVAVTQLVNMQVNPPVPHKRPIPCYDSVPTFDSEQPDQSVSQWCEKVDELSEVYGWTPEMTTYAATSNFRGLALVWYKSLPSLKFTWEELKWKLNITFSKPKDFHQLLLDMTARKKRPNESLERYYFEKMALINACRIIVGEDAVSCVIGGIEDPSLTNAAKAKECQTPESLLHYFNTLATPPPAASTKAPTSTSSSNTIHSNTNHTSARKTPQLTCHNCGKLGHIARKCRSAPKQPPVMSDNSNNTSRSNDNQPRQSKECTFCRKKGHLASECWSKQRADKSNTVSSNPKVQ